MNIVSVSQSISKKNKKQKQKTLFTNPTVLTIYVILMGLLIKLVWSPIHLYFCFYKAFLTENEFIYKPGNLLKYDLW